MSEASSVYFQCVNERAAHVKIDRVSCYRMVFDCRGFMNENQKALGV